MPARVSSALLLALTALGVPPAAASEAGRGAAARPLDPWRLRPSDVVPAEAGPARDAKGRPVSEIPEERRVVRVVYPGLTNPR
ncbi:hypothetical protein ASG51_01185 [Methylobacterium sp. Leaf465]|uniref:hypothetical protein n=1 Tax=unclassified Methylobacterium TaxID=2615210 RepID=UPI0006FE40D1|nr:MULTISPECIES: hypothetical protein [unclassified Methylobacterium]KQP54313.1 hypothetical protein ASF41_11480 [Methylobacterium sp. Leaf111]KQT84728.1 hypothetical protein ASG51_01185 [Methylobacterium sp. Leaf465]KQU35248.1 hypothetical protein ASG63_01045 [Methylobacterium sp. Leaf94]